MPATSCYRWGVGVSPVLVDLDLDLVERLRREIARAVVVEGRQMEIGGLLLGSTHEDVVEVHDFRLVPSEHRRGASFDLSPRDRIGLQRDLAKFNRSKRLNVVGYFRTHTRPGLYLDETDHSIARDYFANPSQVFLLIRPDDPPQAGFFFWEEGEINRKQTYLPFPFEPSLLADHEPSPVDAPKLSTHPVPVPVRVDSGQKTAVRQESSKSSRPGLLLVPFAVGALAAIVLPWLTSREPVEPKKVVQTEPKHVAKSVPLFRGTSEELPPPNSQELSSEETPAQLPAPGVVIPAQGPAIRLKSDTTAPITKPVRERYGRTLRPAPISQPETRLEARSDNPPSIQPPPEPPLLVAKATPPEPISSLAKPLHHAPGLSPITTGVALEPVNESVIRRTINRVPLLSHLQRHRYKSGDDFVPARPIHDPKPVVPNSIARELTGPTPVDVKLTVAKDGRVSEVELLSKDSDAQLRDIVLGTATQWNFEPARIKGKPVDSQIVAHFRFEPRF